MQADGSDPRRLTTTSVLDESPDWQPLPFTIGEPSHPCGDLSLLPGGVASIAAARLSCTTARRVAARWSPEAVKVHGFTCTRTPHSFDQEVVQCEQRCGRKGIAFVWRRPAS